MEWQDRMKLSFTELMPGCELDIKGDNEVWVIENGSKILVRHDLRDIPSHWREHVSELTKKIFSDRVHKIIQKYNKL